MKSGVEHLAAHPGWKSKPKKSRSAAPKKRPRSTVSLDASELATVLAALRLFQREHENMDSVQIADAWPMHFNVQGDGKDVSVEPEPLGSEAIDALCERINCGS